MRARRKVLGWGVDGDAKKRPGVPRELRPEVRGGAHWEAPEQQARPGVQVLKRASLEELTPVFGTTAPPRGLSGLLRRVAYGIPEYRVKHVLLLLLADRVDVLESLVRRHPTKAAGLVLGLVGGGLLLRRSRA